MPFQLVVDERVDNSSECKATQNKKRGEGGKGREKKKHQNKQKR